MLIQYAYIKSRSQFGKQCLFKETDPIVETNILPEPELMQNYIHQKTCDQGVQKSTQFAFHEMQTVSNLTKESGVLHFEGGWPKEINLKDEEVMLRFRRRVEKDENWAPRMKKLLDPMEHNILQNNAIDIYDYYFDDMVPSRLLSLDLRISNVYSDPQSIVRPVSHLSWSPDVQNRLAASYSFMAFETKLSDVNPSSYIWDIENPNTPVMCLRSSTPLIITEFNPRDPSILISGLMSGQVCNWDIRIGDRPVQMSHRQFSHRNPANQALWITSKTNTEFFSASTDGTIRWWDIRNLRQPTDMIVMDLDDPHRPDMVRSIGVTALHFEPTMAAKFLVGMENGMVINVNRKTASPVDKLATRFNCHVGPVIAIDRNPFAIKNFLTVGDMTVKIWADDIRENSIIAFSEQNVHLNGACWSKCRYSMFFTINAMGYLEIYDILTNIDSPVTTFHVCDECLTTIAPHEYGQFLAVGSYDGKIYLLECSEGHTVSTKIDRANLIAYLERCSRFEKVVEMRLKEIRVVQESEDFVEERPVSVTKNRHKKRNNKKNSKDKTQVMEKGDKKRSRLKKVWKDPFFEDLVNTELAFFHAVEKRQPKLTDSSQKLILSLIHQLKHVHQPKKFKDAELQALLDENSAQMLKELTEALNEFASYPYLEEIEQIYSVPKVPRKKKKIIKVPKIEDEIVTQEQLKKLRIEKSRMRYKLKSIIKIKAVEEEEPVTEMEAPLVKKTVKKRCREKILKKVCSVEICKPEICCADMEEKQAAKLQTQFWLKEKESSRDMTRQVRKLSYRAQKLLERSAVSERRISVKDGSLPDVLADEVEEAKREMRAWQERVTSKRDFWLPRTTEIVYEKLEKKKKKVDNGDDESPVRGAGKERSDFQQLSETSLKWKSGSTSEDKIPLAGEQRETEKLNPHLEKCAQEGDTHSTLFTNTDEATETTTRPTQRE